MTIIPSMFVAGTAREILPTLQAWGFVASLPEIGFAGPEDEPLQLDPSFELETLSHHPRIAIWREAYRRMGLKPSEFRSSVEQLVRRHLRSGIVLTGIPAVDTYNRISVKHCVPLGGYDLEQLTGDAILVRTAASGDHFDALGGTGDKMPILPSVVCYTQLATIICWAINCRDNRSTAITAKTRRILFTSEAMDDLGGRASEIALSEIGAIIAAGGGRVGPIEEFKLDD